MKNILLASALLPFVLTPSYAMDSSPEAETTSYVQGCPYYHPVYNLTFEEAEEVCQEWARENNRPGGEPGGEVGPAGDCNTATRLCDREDY